MYNNEIKDKFVELRAAGKSFGDISQELGVVKSTLHRWEDERADDIARLRRIAWEETEAEIGFRLEEQLAELACDIKDFQSSLDRVNRNKLSVRETMMLLRESRREYFRLRNMLMDTASRSRSQRKISPSASPQSTEISNAQSEIPAPSLLPALEVPPETKSNEIERFNEIASTQHRHTNDLQQSVPQSFDFPVQGRAAAPPAAAPAHNPNRNLNRPEPEGVEPELAIANQKTKIETSSASPRPCVENNAAVDSENPAKIRPFTSQNSGGHNSNLSTAPHLEGRAPSSPPPPSAVNPAEGRAAAPPVAAPAPNPNRNLNQALDPLPEAATQPPTLNHPNLGSSGSGAIGNSNIHGYWNPPPGLISGRAAAPPVAAPALNPNRNRNQALDPSPEAATQPQLLAAAVPAQSAIPTFMATGIRLRASSAVGPPPRRRPLLLIILIVILIVPNRRANLLPPTLQPSPLLTRTLHPPLRMLNPKHLSTLNPTLSTSKANPFPSIPANPPANGSNVRASASRKMPASSPLDEYGLSRILMRNAVPRQDLCQSSPKIVTFLLLGHPAPC